jgi:hypothetical protein
MLFVTAKELGVNEVDGTDVEGRRDLDASAQAKKMLDEVETHLTVIETAVNVGGLRGNETLCPDRFGETNEKPHREACRVVRACERVAIHIGESDRHGDKTCR